jgi:endoglucanase
MYRKMKKRILSIFIIAAMLLTLIPALVMASEAEDYSNLLGNANVRKPATAGALRIREVNGVKTLTDKNGQPIQLRGMSTHGLQWFPQIINNNAFAALANDWGSNVIRLAMYVGENGYATNPSVKDKVIEGIDLAIANDMYVIVDWHVHAPGDPRDDVYEGAMDFFEEIAEKYPNNPNIIYELANEPSSNNNGGKGIPNTKEGWQAVKEYAEPIIAMLRGKGNENLIIVGNPNWCQRPDLAADDPIDDDNTIYAVHFYSGTHAPEPDSYVMKNLLYAMEKNLPVFVSEWGTSQANGDGGPYLAEADKWLNFLNANNISWINWSLTNKNETSGAFTPFVLGKSTATDLNPGDDQVWSPMELSLSGEYVRARIKGIPYEPVDRAPKEELAQVIWDFNDGTRQGFVLNNDSPTKTIVTSNENNMLKVSGLAVNRGIWDNRINADGVGVDITGAEKMTIDVVVDAPAAVSIGVVAQGAANNYWTSPRNPGQLSPSDFVLQGDGKYKATLTVTKEDAPGLEIIGSNTDNPRLTGVVLLIGTSTETIYLDNITVISIRDKVEQPIVHAPQGIAQLPSDFEDSTRQGWRWQGESGVKTALTIEEANGSKALSWEYAYPEVKPSDGWASAPRLDFWMDNMVMGDNDYVAFDLYVNPVRASEGTINIHLIFQPPTLGWWAQAPDTYTIELDKLASAPRTTDGLYHYEVKLDASKIANLQPNTVLRNMILVFADGQSNFAGRMYIDNVRFGKTPVQYSINVEAAANGSITASTTTAIAGTTIDLTIEAEEGYRLKAGTLKYNDGVNDVYIEGTSFLMPEANVTVTAEFELDVYEIIIPEFEGGIIKGVPKTAKAGDRIHVIVIPGPRYRFDPKSVRYYDGTEEVRIHGNHFIMPESDVTIIVDFIQNGKGK